MSLYDRDDDSRGGGSGDGDERGRPRRAPRCPICQAPTVVAHRPFCSRRCADIDLHRWLSGVYRVPTPEKPGSESEEEDR
jgi:endogenous inhibitor of DNA gyrase (YacG/DUF329 family)